MINAVGRRRVAAHSHILTNRNQAKKTNGGLGLAKSIFIRAFHISKNLLEDTRSVLGCHGKQEEMLTTTL